MLKVFVIVSETSLLVGCGLGRVVGPNFSFVMGRVELVETVGGLDWAGSKKMDLWTTLVQLISIIKVLKISKASRTFV